MKVEVKKSERKNAPEGLHPARLIQIVDLGTQLNENFNKKERRVRLAWELIGITFETEEGEEVNHLVSKEYSLKLSRKAHLRKAVEGMLGKSLDDGGEFEFKNLLDIQCQISIKHNNGTGKNAHEVYANVDSVLPVGKDPKGKAFKYDRAQRDLVLFSLDEIDEEVLGALPDWLQDTIMESDEYIAYTEDAQTTAVKGKKPQAVPTKKSAPAKSAPAKAPAKKVNGKK
jgi:hypothetical protein